MGEKLDKLSSKRRAFVEFYCRLWDGAKAARAAGYAERSARQQASRLLTNDDIKAAIDERLAEMKMKTDEILVRLSEQARAEYAQYFQYRAVEDEKGQIDHFEIRFDFDACEADGRLHLIKKVKHDRHNNIEIEFHDAQTALIKLGQHQGLFNADGETSVNVNVTLDADELARRREIAQERARQYEDNLLNGGGDDANGAVSGDAD